MKPTKLKDDEVKDLFSKLKGWNLIGNQITKTFQFANFAKSMEFVNCLAESAEAVNHHPDIDIRYSKVTVTLSTHEVNGLSTHDFELAGLADGYGDMLIKGE